MPEIGEGRDSVGSELIIRAVDKEDDRIVHLGLWGGANTLAQVLWKVRSTRSEEEVNAFIEKMQVYAISDQVRILASLHVTGPIFISDDHRTTPGHG